MSTIGFSYLLDHVSTTSLEEGSNNSINFQFSKGSTSFPSSLERSLPIGSKTFEYLPLPKMQMSDTFYTSGDKKMKYSPLLPETRMEQIVGIVNRVNGFIDQAKQFLRELEKNSSQKKIHGLLGGKALHKETLEDGDDNLFQKNFDVLVKNAFS